MSCSRLYCSSPGHTDTRTSPIAAVRSTILCSHAGENRHALPSWRRSHTSDRIYTPPPPYRAIPRTSSSRPWRMSSFSSPCAYRSKLAVSCCLRDLLADSTHLGMSATATSTFSGRRCIICAISNMFRNPGRATSALSVSFRSMSSPRLDSRAHASRSVRVRVRKLGDVLDRLLVHPGGQ